MATCNAAFSFRLDLSVTSVKQTCCGNYRNPWPVVIAVEPTEKYSWLLGRWYWSCVCWHSLLRVMKNSSMRFLFLYCFFPFFRKSHMTPGTSIGPDRQKDEAEWSVCDSHFLLVWGGVLLCSVLSAASYYGKVQRWQKRHRNLSRFHSGIEPGGYRGCSLTPDRAMAQAADAEISVRIES